MHRVFNSIVILLILFLLIPFPSEASRGIKSTYVSPSGKAVTGNNWLFVIGINDYEKWPKLQTAVNDAKSLKKVLLERYCFDQTNTIELYDDKANRKNIIGQMRHLAKTVKKNDSLVIFYAGHGHIDSITKEGSWIPVNSDMENSASWVSNHDIKKYLSIDAIKAKHILLISDSCFSGDFFRGKRGKLPDVTSAVIKKAYKLTSRQAITSGGIEPVSDAGFGNNSVFSHFFIKTLNENSNPFLIPSELFPDVKAGVAENADQFPQYGALNGTGGQHGGELVFFLKQDTQLKDLSASAIAKNKELEYLKKLEHELQKSKKKEAAEIAKQKKELAAMDAKIEAMKNRLGTPSERSNDSLKNMLAMVRQKESQRKKLKDLKRAKTKEAAKRQAEINRIKRKSEEKELATLKADLRDYHEIVTSEFGKDMAETAWNSLVKKYPQRSKGVQQGDVTGLIGPGRIYITPSPASADIISLHIEQEYKAGLKLSPGSYSFQVSAEGYFSKIVKVKIKGGETTRTSVSLKRGIENSVGMKFVYINPGSFNLGSNNGGPDEQPVHRVTIKKGFYLQKTEVTQKQWRSVMDDNPSNFNNCDDCPVESVSWDDVMDYIEELNSKEDTNKYRLPTEAEWEYACRAGSKTDYANGHSLGVMAWYSENSGMRTHSVAGKKANAWGLYDMHGNVYEWVEDWYGSYPSANVTDPTGNSTGSSRVFRGGSWSFSATYCRSAVRYYGSPDDRSNIVGFRLSRAH